MTKGHVYCTIFDSAYLPRALALHESLIRHSTTASLAFFCVDDRAAELLSRMSLDRAHIVPHAQFATPVLDGLRAARSRAEYCWTCKPFALLHAAHRVPDAAWIIYVDTDMMFYGDPDVALPKDRHYLITPHNFHSAFLKYGATAGQHNAGYFGMRNSEFGRSVAEWWAERCIESCSRAVSETMYGDQKYLDRMRSLFPFGMSSLHPGLNAAPWNVERFTLDEMGGQVMLDGQPLLLYHFQSLKILNDRLVDLYAGNRTVGQRVRRLIYTPYLHALKRAYERLESSLTVGWEGVQPGLAGPREWLRFAYEVVRGYHNVTYFRLAS